jgi:hypothetical protein
MHFDVTKNTVMMINSWFAVPEEMTPQPGTSQEAGTPSGEIGKEIFWSNAHILHCTTCLPFFSNVPR